MKVVTWNLNSLKARKERLFALLERHSPDVVALQELKGQEDKFPFDELKEAGYHSAVLGQKTYNGVALLSKAEPTDVVKGIEDDYDDPQARLIAATIAGVRIYSAYFPNGGKVGSDKWAYKLEWMDRIKEHLEIALQDHPRLLLCGDFNVATDDLDVNRIMEWEGTGMCADEGRERLEALRDLGLRDVFREKHPEGKVFSWWDYRMLGFPKNNGLRIDYIYATAELADACTSSEVDRNERKGKSPSDHAPVIADFDLS